MARCTTATARRDALAQNSLPNARRALSGTPSQKLYACVVGSSVATCADAG